MQCPKCGSGDQLSMAGGVFLCLDCRHEHDGTQTMPVAVAEVLTDPVAFLERSATTAIMESETADEVLGIYDDTDDADDSDTTVALDDTQPIYAGRFVRLRNQPGLVLVTSDDDDDLLTCEDELGSVFSAQRSDVVHVDDDGTDPLAPVVGAETVSEDQPLEPTIFAVASLAITQGLACIGDDDGTLYNPRIGWLPPPCNQVPEAEQGVAYAIALLIVTFGLDKASVEQIAATLMQGASGPEMELQQ